mmetsp:Transcript_26118/g.71990  ORF Transcript_26118/g.71990 Transcript_26118/m.71990 type:complete len:215 (+) Transcript_26118:588-1232(+)
MVRKGDWRNALMMIVECRIGGSDDFVDFRLGVQAVGRHVVQGPGPIVGDKVRVQHRVHQPFVLAQTCRRVLHQEFKAQTGSPNWKIGYRFLIDLPNPIQQVKEHLLGKGRLSARQKDHVNLTQNIVQDCRRLGLVGNDNGPRPGAFQPLDVRGCNVFVCCRSIVGLRQHANHWSRFWYALLTKKLVVIVGTMAKVALCHPVVIVTGRRPKAIPE